MPKYRHLTNEELNIFKKEFIEFLVLNGIEADHWEIMKDEQTHEVNKILELFSDVIFEKIARKTQYLVFANSTQLFAFNYGMDKATLLIAENASIIMHSFNSESEILKFIDDKKQQLLVSFQEKEYVLSREEEVFRMMQSCMVVKEKIFDQLLSIYNSKSNQV